MLKYRFRQKLNEVFEMNSTPLNSRATCHWSVSCFGWWMAWQAVAVVRDLDGLAGLLWLVAGVSTGNCTIPMYCSLRTAIGGQEINLFLCTGWFTHR